MHTPVIVVVAYNRPISLERLLSSLKNAKNIANAKLIISVDNKEPENYPVRDLANAFDWPFGEKEVIYQKTNLGLRKHILQCGDYAVKYGSVIILEDDLFVSPYFYDYTVKAIDFFGSDPKIGGISLFNYSYEDMTELPFVPITDDSDNYFIQFPSSLGQAWTANQWKQFREWYDKKPDLSQIRISPQALSWYESSWKKYFNGYLVEKNKYFAFPRISLTTNFNDRGTHKSLDINHMGQTPLQLSEVNYRFKPVSTSYCIYDAHFELIPESVKRFSPELKEYSFEMDLYGHKDISKIETPYVITSRYADKYLWGYERALKPHDMNILFNRKGDTLLFCRREDIQPRKYMTRKRLSDYKYYYSNDVDGFRVKLYNRLKKYKLFSLFCK
jgi:hypothetical protein